MPLRLKFATVLGNPSAISCHRSYTEIPAPFSTEICPPAKSSFVRIQTMNTDYGFFHLFKALKSLQESKAATTLPEAGPTVEVKLPQIDYSLLTSLPARERGCQQDAWRWDRFNLQTATAIGR